MQLPLVVVNFPPVDKGVWGGEEVRRTGWAEKAHRSGQRQRPEESEMVGRETDRWGEA